MEEKTKKRSRKTKLVPREYLDSDDENIAKMQVGPPFCDNILTKCVTYCSLYYNSYKCNKF